MTTNVAHAAIADPNIHEPKGAAAASANRIYVSDGAGSGNWSTVPKTGLAPTANPFGANLLHVRDEQSSGTSPQSLAATAWTTRILNVVKTNLITGASLASNQITLPAGTYFTNATTMWGVTNSVGGGSASYKSKLRNVTSSTDLVIGMSSVWVGTNTFYNPIVPLVGTFTLSGISLVELQYYFTVSGSINYAGGAAMGIGVVEVYSDVLIWQVT